MADLSDLRLISNVAPAEGRARLGWMTWGVAAVLLIGLLVPDQTVSIALAGIGAVLGLALLIWQFRNRDTAKTDEVANFRDMIAHDERPIFVTKLDGEVLARNAAANSQFGMKRHLTLEQSLVEDFNNAGAILFRMQTKATRQNACREDIVTRSGRFRFSVHKLTGEAFLWAIEPIDLPEHTGRIADRMSLPMLTVGDSGAVLFMNAALRRLMGRRIKRLDQVLTDTNILTGETVRLAAHDEIVEATVTIIEGKAGRTEYYFAPVSNMTTQGAGLPDLEDFPVAIFGMSVDGKLTQANKLARGLLGSDDPTNQYFGELVEGLGRPISDWLEDASEGRSLHRPEVLRLNSRGDETYLQVTLGRVIDDGDVSLLAMLNDATELKTLEKQFVQSQKMQAIGQLAGGVAHDFNNLLTAISGHCDLLMLRHDPGDPDFGDLEQINQNANRAASLVGQLLAFSRKQNLQLEVLDMRDTLADLAHLLNRLVGAQITLSLNHDPQLMSVRADRRQIEQVIMNLVLNARDALEGTGEIAIDTRNVKLQSDLKRDRVVVPTGDYVLVKVTDSGVGIPDESLGKIFEPFFTTKDTGQGTGLGLSTAYGIVKQSGGFIFADSKVGKGTSFSIFFPTIDRAVEPMTREKPVIDTEIEYAPVDGKILLVEDEAPVRAFASRALQLRGFEVVEAGNADEALRLLEDPDFEVDVVVTDVVMPGLDGPSWVKLARENRPDLKVVFVSGYTEDHLEKGNGPLPNSVFLPKPFSLNELTNVVRGQLSEAA